MENGTAVLSVEGLPVSRSGFAQQDCVRGTQLRGACGGVWPRNAEGAHDLSEAAFLGDWTGRIDRASEVFAESGARSRARPGDRQNVRPLERRRGSAFLSFGLHLRERRNRARPAKERRAI